MGTLEHAPSGAQFPLALRTLVGRSHSCQLRLSSEQVSGVHAELLWDGERWFVHDLGSRNGTHLDDRPLTSERREPLHSGSRLAFGTERECFVLIDSSPPGLVAIDDEGVVMSASAGLLCLPSEEDPEVTFFEQLDGSWRMETEGGGQALAHQERVSAGGSHWCIHLPGAVQHTDADGDTPMNVSNIALDFSVSRDEEHVQVHVRHGAKSIDLRPRAHDFFLLTLARARLGDREQPGLEEMEHGWVYRQDLCHRLRVDRNLLNLWIYRARRQFADAGVLDVAQLIERREGAEQLRMGVSRLRID